MNAKEFLKHKGIFDTQYIVDCDGESIELETLLIEYQALQLQQTGVIKSVCNSCGGKKIKLENGFERCKKCQKLFA